MLRFHARHTHVPGRKAAVDRRDVLFPEAEEREELDRRASIGHRDSNVIRIEEHLTLTRQRRMTHLNAGDPPFVSVDLRRLDSPSR